MIGIIVADQHELNQFDFPMIDKITINQFEFWTYSINSKQVIVVHSGIGIVNAAAATQQLISSFQVNEIYSYGAVGGDNSTSLYEVVIPKRIYFYDVKTPWYAFGQTPGEMAFYENALEGTDKNLASGNSFLAEASAIEQIKNHIPVSIFDMETAGIAQVAFKNNVALKVIKCVSDVIGMDASNLEDINERITKAGKIAFQEMLLSFK